MVLIKAGALKKRYFRNLWQHRSLIVAFMQRDIKIHYAQTRLGLALSFLQAIVAAVLFEVFFGRLLKVETPLAPYIIYAFPGIMSWYFFSHIVNYSGTSLIQSQDLIKKIYFPKLVLPLYKAMVGLVEFLIWSLVYFALMLVFSYTPSWRLLLLPIAAMAIMINGLSIGIWLSALTTRSRDAIHIIPFLIGFGVFVTPVFFSANMIPVQFSVVNLLNPMSAAIDLVRWCFVGGTVNPSGLLSFILSILLLISGLLYFRSVDAAATDTL